MLFKKNAPVITPEHIHQHMINMFSAANNPVMAVPYNGAVVWCRLKRLNQVEIKSCGDFSVIETVQDIINKKHIKPDLNSMSDYAETQHNIIKESLIQPRYEELTKIISKDFDISDEEINNKLKKIEELFYKLRESKDINDKRKMKLLQDEYAALELRYKFRFPADFTGYVMAYALSLDITDIGKVTEEMLYNSAIMAKLNRNAPHENLTGNFIDYMKTDIDNRAWSIFFDKQEKNKQNQPIERRK
jgi:hypothetical protein